MVNSDAGLDQRLRASLHAAADQWEPDQQQAFRELQRHRQQRGNGVADRAFAAVLSCFPTLGIERVSVAARAPLPVASRVAVFSPTVATLPSQSTSRASLLGFIA
jgi:hypothetical protein